MILAAVLPFAERSGFWDAWPSFALYSAHDERMVLLIGADDLAVYPEGVQRHFVKQGAFAFLSLGDWSLAERRAPIYPQGRALNGVAEAVAARYRGRRPVSVLHHGRADATTGVRVTRNLFGIDEIRRHGDSYLLNAHPVP
jgi:hypothetical protein